MNALFGNSGKRVCVLAFVVCIIGLVSMGIGIVLMLLGLLDGAEELFFGGLIVLIGGAMTAFSSLFLYAFGQLVSDTHAIKEKVAGSDKPNAYKTYAPASAPQPMYQPQGYAPAQPQYQGYPMQNQ